MIPGADQVVACPHCQGLARYGTLRSGNSSGARIWTDGKRIVPMHPTPPPVVKCRHCAQPYWLTDAKEIGTIRMQQQDPSADPAWRAAETVEEASEGEYYQALEAKLAADRALEKMYRTFVWWRGNDADRQITHEEEGIETAYPEAFRSNLVALTPFFNETKTNERLMKAEALRELAEFDAARELLSHVREPNYERIVRLLQNLCEREDTCVREIQADL